MVELIFHGAAEEVGRSCIELRARNSRVLLDAGLWIAEHGTEFPSNIDNIKMIDAVFLSHAHLDHTGSLPLFEHLGINCPIFSNTETKLMTKILLKDSFKISRVEHEHVAYKERDIEKTIGMFHDIRNREPHSYKDLLVTYFDAGHIPGSSSILIKNEGKTLLYTGDINTNETMLLKPADTDYGSVDYMITESTYGNRDHPNREEQKKEFIASIKKTLERGGKALIAAFAVGRAQEILMILDEAKIECPIYIDGMAKSITEIMINHPYSLKNGSALKKAAERAKFLTDDKERSEALSSPCVIISTSGMVNGGPILSYLKKLSMDSKSSIIMTGYQGKNTNGRMLIENGAAYLDGSLTRVKIEVLHYDFSAHSGMKELHDLVMKVKPKTLIIQHGDIDSVREFSEWCRRNNIDTIVAKRDQKITLT
jgi:putative mRNA 3-end processing factor